MAEFLLRIMASTLVAARFLVDLEQPRFGSHKLAMLFFITGANGVGKTACVPHFCRLLPTLRFTISPISECPPNPDVPWRQETTELWLQTYLKKHQPLRRHLAVSGEAIFGEVLCAPSIEQIDAVHTCLRDCDDVTRVDRLRARGTYGPNMQILCWAAFLRVHAVDPGWSPEVIQTGESIMRWEKWNSHQRGDEVWRQEVIDTSRLTLEEVTAEIERWIRSRLDG